MIVRGGEVDASRSASLVEWEWGVGRGEARRDLLEREMRTRERLGSFWLRRESWERKWRPTPPAPGECQAVMIVREVFLLRHAINEHGGRKKMDNRVHVRQESLS